MNPHLGSTLEPRNPSTKLGEGDMMRLARKWIGLVAAMAAMLTVPSIESASANHGVEFGHWHHGPGQYSAPPIYDRNNTFRNGANPFADAANHWRVESNWSIRPYLAVVGGNPWDCSPKQWAIVVCVANLGTVGDVRGDATVGKFDGTHIIWGVIRINAQRPGGFDDETLIRTVRHELGHTIGLGHNTVCCNSVMTAPFPAGRNANQHDRDVLWSVNAGHGH